MFFVRILLTFSVMYDIIFLTNIYSKFFGSGKLQVKEQLMVGDDRKRAALDPGRILYVVMFGNYAEIHTYGGGVTRVRMTLGELERELGSGFVKIHRGCIVSAEAVYNVADRIYLNNGEALDYTRRRKKEIRESLDEQRRLLIDRLSDDGGKMTAAGYREHYRSFEELPFAFTDIEMVFDEERHAVDWIFRYGNRAFAEIEKRSLDEMIGNLFSAVFANSDTKWLRSCERAALHGETIEMMDYSEEIGTHLKAICFQTFRGHCGVILFDASEITFTETSGRSRQTAEMYYNGKFIRTD